MKVLTFTTLFPNVSQQRHGIFIEERIRLLNQRSDMEIRVVAPVPWFPYKQKIFKKYSVYSAIPQREVRSGLHIYHPKYPVIPKIGMSISPFLLAGTTYRVLKKIQQEDYNFDLIDSHYFYPDGVAAVILGKLLRKPVMVTARGSDINLISKYSIPKKQIQWAANHAHQVATVSQDLKDRLVDLGVEESGVRVLRNGVDLIKFRPHDRGVIRKNMGVNNFTIISVGNLVELKGHHLIIESLTKLQDVELIIIGEGSMRANLQSLAISNGVQDRVKIIGNVPQSDLCRYYNAADVLVLASSREGMANVLLEALACGTPVLSTDVGGSREIIQDSEAGVLIQNRSTIAIVRGIEQLRKNYPLRKSTRKYAERFSWDETLDSIKDCFNNVCLNAEKIII